MPKISYLDKDKSLVDDTEVTQEQIEDKIAEIEALLRGRIDEDNLLSYRNDVTPIGIPPSLVTDLPSETKPVNNCMKFFGNTADHPDSIVDTLFLKSVDLMNLNPRLVLINGIGDSEIEIITEVDKDKTTQKSVKIEIANNEVLMTWRDLWEVLANVNLQISVNFNSSSSSDEDKYIVSDNPFFSMGGFLDEFGVNADDLVYEMMFNIEDAHFIEYFIQPEMKRNQITVVAQVYPSDSTVENIFRFVPSFLCKRVP